MWCGVWRVEMAVRYFKVAGIGGWLEWGCFDLITVSFDARPMLTDTGF